MQRAMPLLLAFFLSQHIIAQNKLPLQEQFSVNDHPFIFLVSGDGGVKGFTASLCKSIHEQGYSIAALDAKSYFWDKKTPEQTAADIGHYVAACISARGNRGWIMVGYSFGADIAPFVVNRLPDSLKAQLRSVILLAPSSSTDFEIHLSDMLGFGRKRSMDVLAEINRMGRQYTATIFGEDEHSFPMDQIKLANYRNELIKGGHHFDGNYEAVAARIIALVK